MPNLTPREREVFALVVRGKLNKQIAFALSTSEPTVKAHRRAVMEKLEVDSFAESVSIAERPGMLGNSGEKNSRIAAFVASCQADDRFGAISP